MKQELKKKHPSIYKKMADWHIFFIRLQARILRAISNAYEELANGRTSLEPVETKNGWSVVIITAGTANNLLEQAIASVKREFSGTPYEVIIVGPSRLKKEPFLKDAKIIPYYELNISPGLITKKKNMGVAVAMYDKVILSHDYVAFESGFREGFEKFGYDFDVCMTPVINSDGTRWIDWLGYFPGIGFAMIPYESEGVKYQYINGTYFIVKRNFFARFPLDERLRWNEGEDSLWSSQIRNFTRFKMNTQSSVKLLKYKKLREELVPNGEKVKAMLAEQE